MNKRTLRRLFKWSFLLNIALFLLTYADYARWDSKGMIAILSFYAAFLVGLIVLLIIDEGPRYQRVEFNAPKEGAKTVVYRRP